MKSIKRGIAALLAGEFATLRYKDKSFKAKVKKALGPADTLKVVFDGLFELNKNIFKDIQDSNFEQMKEKAVGWFSKEADLLEAKLDEREDNFETRSDEKLPIFVMGLEKQFQKYEKKAMAWKEKLIDEYDLASTLEMFTKRIITVRKALEEKNV